MNALQQYIQISGILRSIMIKTYDGLVATEYDGPHASNDIMRYIRDDLRRLRRLWPEAESPSLDALENDFRIAVEDDTNERWYKLKSILEERIPMVAHELDDLFASFGSKAEAYGFESLLHPVIIKSSYSQYRRGHYRDAVVNGIMAVFELVRERTGLKEDGSKLATAAFSLDKPFLILSTLDTESGKNEQKGFIQLLQGVYQGIRNPKAHSLASDLTEANAAQHLVLASLLARRVGEARLVCQSPQESQPSGGG